MAKKRIMIDLPPELLKRVEAEAVRLSISRNEALARILEAGLGREEVYLCPFCRTECRPGVSGCIHFDPEDVTWGMPDAARE
jgi:hypothetical protein